MLPALPGAGLPAPGTAVPVRGVTGDIRKDVQELQYKNYTVPSFILNEDQSYVQIALHYCKLPRYPGGVLRVGKLLV